MESQIKIQDVRQIMISETLEWELTLHGLSHTLRGRTIWWNGEEWDEESDCQDISADDIWTCIEDAESYNYQKKVETYTR